MSQNTLGGHGVVDSATVRCEECRCADVCADEELTGVVVEIGRASHEVRGVFAAQSPSHVVVVPLVLDGRRVGSLGVVHREPTTVGELGRRFLRMVGDAVVAGLSVAFEEVPRSRAWSRPSGGRGGRETLRVVQRLVALAETLGRSALPWPERAWAELREGLALLEADALREAAPASSAPRASERAELAFADVAFGVGALVREEPGGRVIFRRRSVRLDVDRARLEPLLATLVSGALVSLDDARLTVGVRRRGGRAVVVVVERGRERPGPALYFGGVLEAARRAGLEPSVRVGRGGVLWEFEAPLAVSDGGLRVDVPPRPSVLLFLRGRGEAAELGRILRESGLEPSEGAEALPGARLAIVEWSADGREFAEALRRERGADFPVVVLAREAPGADELAAFGSARVLRTPVRVAELTLALRLALARPDHPRRPRASEVYSLDPETAGPITRRAQNS